METGCPECGKKTYLHSALDDGHAVMWLHCFGCRWDSERVGVWDVDNLKERYARRPNGMADIEV